MLVVVDDISANVLADDRILFLACCGVNLPLRLFGDVV
jgi:hypothetical protein